MASDTFDSLRQRRLNRRSVIALVCSIVAVAAVAVFLWRPLAPQPPAPPDSRSPTTTAVALCGPDDLDPQPYFGTSEGPVISFAIRVTGSRACRFTAYPVFNGQRHDFFGQPDLDAPRETIQHLLARSPQEVVVPSGRYVTFSMITETNSTPCPATFTYGNVEMVFNGGARYQMTGATFTWNCNMYLRVWSTASSPGSSLRQAP